MKKNTMVNDEFNGKVEDGINEELINDLENEEENDNVESKTENGAVEDVEYDEIIKKYETKLKEGKDNFLRLQADFENFRKRVTKEREEIYLYSLEEIMIQLLAVIDNFDRALDSFKFGNLDKKYIEGLEMIYDNFLEILNKNGLKEIEANNCIFDPNYHHAVMQEETEDDDNTVKEVFQKGYMLNTKVIRPCMVKVAIKK